MALGRDVRSDDGSGQCFGSDTCEGCRNSPPSTLLSRTTSIRNAASQVDLTSRPTASPPLPSGAVSARHKGQCDCPSGDGVIGLRVARLMTVVMKSFRLWWII